LNTKIDKDPAINDANAIERPNRQLRLFNGAFIATNGLAELDVNMKIA